MHKIGDKIVYGAAGVMTIVDIREESFGDVSREYYVLTSAVRSSDSLTYVPADNENLVASMRPLLTEDEIVMTLKSAENAVPIDWIPENRARQEFYKKITESGDLRSMIAMIHRIKDCGRLREMEGKKNFLSDENAKAKAERLIISEISVSLDISEEEARQLLLNAF